MRQPATPLTCAASWLQVGGWIADTLVGRGVSVTRVRKIMQTVSSSDPSRCSTLCRIALSSAPGTAPAAAGRLPRWSGPFTHAGSRAVAISVCCCCHMYPAAHIPLPTACYPSTCLPLGTLSAALPATVCIITVCQNAVSTCSARQHLLPCSMQIGFMGPAFFLTQLSKVTTAGQAVGCMMACQGLDAFSQSGLYSNHQVSFQCV